MMLTAFLTPAAYRCGGCTSRCQKILARQSQIVVAGWRTAAVAIFAAFSINSGFAATDIEAVTPLLTNADPAKGAKLATRCKACHTLNRGGANRFGPALWDVVGRKVASHKGFRFSPSFMKLEGKWDYERLNALIANPNALAPGTRMKFAGIRNVGQRADLIRYLRDLSDNPVPLPVSSAPAQKPSLASAETDEDFGGLPTGTGREEVFYLCNACHSLKTVQQQGLPRDRWDDLLHWMTEKQGMPELRGQERDVVLNYLAEHYGIPEQQPMMMTPLSRPPLMPLPPAPK